MPAWSDSPELRRRTLVDRFEHPVCFVGKAAAESFARANACLRADARIATCADAFDVYLAVKGEKVAGCRFAGDGCVVSVTAGDVFLEALSGKTVEEAKALASAFVSLARDGRQTPGLPELFSLFDRVHAQPGRVGCATTVAQAVLKALA